MSKSEIEAKIEFEKIIGEINKGGYQPIRFTRIKYKASNETHIDIRKFQRGYDNESGETEVFYPTKTGFRFLEKQFRKLIEEYTILPNTYIHPEIINRSFELLGNAQYALAVFNAFKCIETTVRKKLELGEEEYGVRLLRKAFHPETGRLTNYELPKSEREAFSNYISGAFGFYKNPGSHRDIEIDFITAFNQINVASDLLNVIDSAEIKPE